MANLRTRSYITRNDREFFVQIGGEAMSLTRRLAERTEDAARQTAPKGHSGNLARSHFTRGPRRTRFGVYSAQVVNSQPYATYVHNGTGEHAGRSRITAKAGGRLKWTNPSGPYAGTWSAAYVRGQAAQPWLVEAYNLARQLVPGLESRAPMAIPRRVTISSPHSPTGMNSPQQLRRIRRAAAVSRNA